ncbi:MAG: hypothetical protein Q4A72_02150 [Bacillota bacterium]|nr:hypothetical protein [Bacillota bacterium]
MNKVNGLDKYQGASTGVGKPSAEKLKTDEAGGKKAAEGAVKQSAESGESVVYDRSKPFEGISTYDKHGKRLDAESIEQMKAESERQYANMIETIKQMIARQSKEAGGVPKELDFFKRLPKSVAELNGSDGFQASKDGVSKDAHIGEDLNDPNSYWSAEQTAGRIVDFAKKISGGDTKKYEVLKNAIEKGFKAASSYFDKMPDITSKTHDLVMKGLDEWAGKTQEKEKTADAPKQSRAAAL